MDPPLETVLLARPHTHSRLSNGQQAANVGGPAYQRLAAAGPIVYLIQSARPTAAIAAAARPSDADNQLAFIHSKY